ncbi:class I SAM-dependent methyltransferase [Bosea sp. BH3]|uniref:class I SAM-dependent methyltransferase n=1 Tax=Bosea sp. BH3 TaxID=2871701 RepID=UPI0021CB155C|nr:class I SAM-dependent methyltransferase [Bosea sp. BH3]MCU4180677.1 class I SAM-dependent methyltransferase [Bosea sp. BH3]
MDPQQKAVAEEFDQYGDTYDDAVNRSIAFSGKKLEAFTHAKANNLLRYLTRIFGSLGHLSVLDVGCGVGNYHPYLVPHVGSLSGVDVSAACIERAVLRNPQVAYSLYDGGTLPYADQAFDATFCVCVLHHVPPAHWQRFVGELRRVTRRGGSVIIYEHNPDHPLTRKVVGDCAFDRDAVLLKRSQTRNLLQQAGCDSISIESILTVPPYGRLAEWIDSLLRFFPFGTQYRIAATVGHGDEAGQKQISENSGLDAVNGR